MMNTSLLTEVASTAGILLSIWRMHKANIRRAERNAADIAQMRQKIDVMFRWFERTIINGHAAGAD